MASFEDARRFAPDMVAILARITIDARDEIPGRFDEMYVEARVLLADGREVASRCDGPPGCWGAEAVSEAAHLAKVRDCLAVRLDEEGAEAVIGLCRRLDELDTGEIARLMELVATS